MKLDEYFKKYGASLPQLSSVYRKYSNVFMEYYQLVYLNVVFILNENKEPNFICFKNENEEYQRKIRNNEFHYNDYNNIATREEIDRVEKYYSNGFREGFNEVEFQPNLTRNIIDNIIFYDDFTHTFFGLGILRIRGNSVPRNTEDSGPNKSMLLQDDTAYQEGYYEGKRFKSYFLYVEFYDQFRNLPEPFLRPIKYYKSDKSFGFIRYTNDEEFDLRKVQNIDILDDRIKTRQSKEVLSEFFKTRLSDWYSDEDIEHFLRANFKCFDDRRTRKILNSNKKSTFGLPSKLSKWTYEFLRDENYYETKKRYVQMLKSNFSAFSNQDISTIYTNLSKYKS